MDLSVLWRADDAWAGGWFDCVVLVILWTTILLRFCTQHKGLRPNYGTSLDRYQSSRRINVQSDRALESAVRQ